MVVGHQEMLLTTAEAESLCRDDAHDAVQRGLEIYLRRLDRIDPATEVGWLKVVVRNEARAIRKSRAHDVLADIDLDSRESSARDPHDSATGAERVARSAAALRRLRRDDARALIARSVGLSYEEIAQRFGWSGTKVNRCLVRGRAHFLAVYRDIEEGAECERFAPALLDLVAGDADSQAVVELRPHLRACPSCRATVRHLHGARGARRAAALLLPIRWLGERFTQVKAEAYGAAARLSELTASAPLGGGRGAAATALVGICLGGATCVSALGGGEERRPVREGETKRAASERAPRPEAGAARPAARVVAAVPVRPELRRERRDVAPPVAVAPEREPEPSHEFAAPAPTAEFTPVEEPAATSASAPEEFLVR